MAGDSSAVYSNQTIDTSASPYNCLKFIIESVLKSEVNTALPVMVISCTAPGPSGGAGYVSVKPLVTQRGADGNALPPVNLPKLPFYRLQCGTAAVVADPKPGDIGLAVFAQQDSSKVKEGVNDASIPGSYRTFSVSDGFYLGGFVNTAPSTFIHLDGEGRRITIEGPQEVAIIASSEIQLQSPLVTVTGRIVQTGTSSPGGAGAEFTGGLRNRGGTVVSNGVTLETHVHTGVESGPDRTGGPV